MITLEGVAGRRPPLTLSNLSLRWGPGIHAVVGGASDGGPELLALVAGAVRPRAGRVRTLDGSPTEAAVRPRIAFVPREPSLPTEMPVDRIFALAAAIRGEDPRCLERLHSLGIGALASRAVATLSREEVRAVAIAEAATSLVVKVLLLDEPLVAVDARTATHLPEVLRARAREGAAVLIATASVRDAAELADDHVLLSKGAVVGRAAPLEMMAGLPRSGGARLRLLVSDPRELAVALAREPGVDAVARRDEAVFARGPDSVELARAASRAIVASGVDVTEMRIDLPSLDEARAAAHAFEGPTP